MTETALIIGGAGFIGAHLAEELLRSGYRIRVLDNLDGQVHRNGRPAYLSSEAELIQGDVRDRDTLRQALKGADAVCHLAAAVGVGQSMYQIAHYTSVNDLGTAVLLEELAERPEVRRLLVASSMSIYGEGLARAGGRMVEPEERPLEQLKAGQWELRLPNGEVLEPVATPESKRPTLSSIYALNKYNQERMGLIFGRAYNRQVVALRFFNVYGPHQALSNPYTGVLAIFGARLLNGRPPMVFEDGNQRRDFVHVRDVARACRLALEVPAAAGQVINIGSGQSRTVIEVAQALAAATGNRQLTPHVVGKYRAGDIRHCFADISLARRLLGYEPEVRFEDGIAELAEWLSGEIAEDAVEQATEELSKRGLVA